MFFTTGEAPTLNVTPPNRDVTLAPGNTSFYVTSSTSWTVTSSSPWCTVTPSGTGNDSISAVFEANSLFTSRIDTIIVSATGAASRLVTVTQDGIVPVLSVTPLNQNVSVPSGSISFSVTSNLDWLAASDTSWCTVTPSGTGNGTIVANFTGNDSQQQRIAHIRIISPQVSPAILQQNVTVTQAKPGIGIGETNLSGVRIYPNPTRGLFRIVPGKGENETLKVTIENLSGVLILTKECRGEKEYLVDLSQCADGTYNIILKTDHETIVRKLVIIK